MNARANSQQPISRSISDEDDGNVRNDKTEESEIEALSSNNDDCSLPKMPEIAESKDSYRWVSPWILQQLIAKKTDSELIDLWIMQEDIAVRWLSTMRYYFTVQIRSQVSPRTGPSNFFTMTRYPDDRIIQILSSHISGSCTAMLEDLREMRNWVDSQSFLLTGVPK